MLSSEAVSSAAAMTVVASILGQGGQQAPARTWSPSLGQTESGRLIEAARHVQDQRRAVAELASGAATLQNALLAHDRMNGGGVGEAAVAPAAAAAKRHTVVNAVSQLSKEELTESSSGESDVEDSGEDWGASNDPAGLAAPLRRHASLRWRLQWLALRAQEVQQRIERAARAFERRSSSWTPTSSSLLRRDRDTDDDEEPSDGADSSAVRTLPVLPSQLANRRKIIMRRPRQPFNYKAAAPADMPRHPVLSLPEEARFALTTPPPLSRKRSSADSSPTPRAIVVETPLKIKLFRSKSVSGPATPSTSPPATPDSVKRGRSLSGSSTPASPKDVKRRRSSCFDIDNLVIPENMIQPNMRIFTVEYKEIDIPQWRVTSADDVNADMDISSATASSSAAVPVGASEDERELTDDEAYFARHRPFELLESQGRRFDVLSKPDSVAAAARRAVSKTEGRHEAATKGGAVAGPAANGDVMAPGADGGEVDPTATIMVTHEEEGAQQ